MKTYPKNLARVSKYVSRGYSMVHKVSVDVVSMAAAEYCCWHLLHGGTNAQNYVATATPLFENGRFLVVVTYKGPGYTA